MAGYSVFEKLLKIQVLGRSSPDQRREREYGELYRSRSRNKSRTGGKGGSRERKESARNCPCSERSLQFPAGPPRGTATLVPLPLLLLPRAQRNTPALCSLTAETQSKFWRLPDPISRLAFPPRRHLNAAAQIKTGAD